MRITAIRWRRSIWSARISTGRPGGLLEVADKSAANRVVSLLEGGYDLEGLAESAGLHISQNDEGLSMTDSAKPEVSGLSFEKAVAELESIVARLERGDVALDEIHRDLRARRSAEEALRERCSRPPKTASKRSASTVPASRRASSRWMGREDR